jgi:hypothetical protein
MSLTTALATQAEAAFTHKNWKKACLHYDQYFSRVYTQPNSELSDRDLILLLHYARSLFRTAEIDTPTGKKAYDQDAIETVTEYALTVLTRFESAPAGTFSPTDRIDTYELLGQVALLNNQWGQAEEEFRKGYDFACAAGLPWNDRLSLLWSVAIALENAEKPQEAIAVVNDCVALADAELGKVVSPEDADRLQEFRHEFQEKLTELADDAREQEANKDVLKKEEKETEEEEEDAEEEEEEDVAEDGDPPEGPEPTKE